ncbi:FtsX-like permease family protein [bacterium]|nr:FtsX-like permease family protein [bacterium]
MISFIIKGILRDRSRSLFPVMICMCGVFLVFVGDCFMKGSVLDLIDSNANFDTGHVKIVSQAYFKEITSRPLELALETNTKFLESLKKDYPGYRWTRRVVFGGLLDMPDEKGETRSQAPVGAMAMDFLSKGSIEAQNINLKRSLKKGKLISNKNEILVSKKLAETLKIDLGQEATLFCSTVDGGSTGGNFKVVGIVKFGIAQLDKGTILMDVSDADYLLDMQAYSAEILGYRLKGFDIKVLDKFAADFNEKHMSKDEFRPHMITILDQNNLRKLFETTEVVLYILVGIFIFLMTLVLWNAGLISGIRRYTEVGVRLAIGEGRTHIVTSMLVESLITGLIGTFFGIIVALPLAYYFQEVGIDYSEMLNDVAVLMSGIMKAQISARSFIVSIIPGTFASFLGMGMACLGIYKRNTASLFKELET